MSFIRKYSSNISKFSIYKICIDIPLRGNVEVKIEYLVSDPTNIKYY